MSGVFLYTVGYMIFAVYFAVDAPLELYIAGSVAFLVGSVGLVLATWPKSVADCSPFHKAASLFWGSTSFLIGSVAFTVDALRAASTGEYEKWLAIGGYVIFAVGRLYFVWGCTSDEVPFWVIKCGNDSQSSADIPKTKVQNDPSADSIED